MTNDNLVTLAADLSMNSAAIYCRMNKIDTKESGVLCDFIRDEVKATIEKAISDSKAAFEVGMADAASATFSASMRLAGLNAAKKFAERIQFIG